MSQITILEDEVIKRCNPTQGIREANFYQTLNHPGIIQAKSIDYIDGRVQVRMKKLKPLGNEINLKKLFLDMLDVLVYLETQDVLHNDIKPANIMYDQELQRYILIDFGIATQYNHKDRTSPLGIIAPEILCSSLEELNYDIPEHLKIDDTKDSRSDIFGLGACLFILATGHDWLYGFFEGVASLQKSYDQDYFDINSKELKILIKEMMTYNPRKRPTAIQLANRFGLCQSYHQTKLLPTLISSTNNERVIEKVVAIRSKILPDCPHLDFNSSAIVLSFLALNPVEDELIPLYCYSAIYLSRLLCNLGSPPPLYDFEIPWQMERVVEILLALEFKILFDFSNC